MFQEVGHADGPDLASRVVLLEDFPGSEPLCPVGSLVGGAPGARPVHEQKVDITQHQLVQAALDHAAHLLFEGLNVQRPIYCSAHVRQAQALGRVLGPRTTGVGDLGGHEDVAALQLPSCKGLTEACAQDTVSAVALGSVEVAVPCLQCQGDAEPTELWSKALPVISCPAAETAAEADGGELGSVAQLERPLLHGGHLMRKDE
mmetsp:Transcript_8293/g.12047  ORF Transcript_8293/g.12047 Transcript_8293/m.12047 type:complete len:203 (+) Transcript_8293:810-1418(+)